MAALSIAPGDLFSEWWDRYNSLVDAQIASITVIGTTMRFTYVDGSITDVPIPTPPVTSSGLTSASNGLSVTGSTVKLGGAVTSAVLSLTGGAGQFGVIGVGTGGTAATETGFGISNGAAPYITAHVDDLSGVNSANMLIKQASGAVAPSAEIGAYVADGNPTPPASNYSYVRTIMESGVGKVKVAGKVFVNAVPFEAGRVTSVLTPGQYDELDPLPGDLVVLTGVIDLEVSIITGRVGALLYVSNISTHNQQLAFLKFEGNISTTSIDTINSSHSRIYAYVSDTIGWVRLNYY